MELTHEQTRLEALKVLAGWIDAQPEGALPFDSPIYYVHRILATKELFLEPLEIQAGADKEASSNIPTGPGHWWAKTGRAKWCNVLVEVYGEAPFLQLRAWDRFENKIINLKASDITEWVWKIVDPS